ncbi:hypothetical protein RRF57_003951 [Xylaria bambusicola]|uniref:Uncharacterized protein n=1 Tax=Xylaria bambusicola TaxID=326684 RepID=A0AAN7Z815_9PEZI
MALPSQCNTSNNLLLSSLPLVVDVLRVVLLPYAAASSVKRVASAVASVVNAALSAAKYTQVFNYERIRGDYELKYYDGKGNTTLHQADAEGVRFNLSIFKAPSCEHRGASASAKS